MPLRSSILARPLPPWESMGRHDYRKPAALHDLVERELVALDLEQPLAVGNHRRRHQRRRATT